MATDLTHQDDLKGLRLLASQATDEQSVRRSAGTTPNSLINASIIKDVTIRGITPNDFLCGLIEFDFKALVNTFSVYCKDFNDNIENNKAYKALQFSSIMLFELGTYIKTAKKTKRGKMRFRFYYKKEDGTLSIKVVTVILTTFCRDKYNLVYKNMEEDEEMVITLEQALLLAMMTFDKAMRFTYQQDGLTLMIPLCRAVFSQESIPIMARALKMEDVEMISIINQSTCRDGQYLPNSDLACALVGMISATKHVTNQNVRNLMISKLIKQYTAKHKAYYSERFNVFAQHALGGVTPGLDAETLIQNFSNIQVSEISSRAQVIAIRQSEVKLHVPTQALATSNISGGYQTSSAKRT